MSSDEDFDSTPEIRRIVGDLQTVRPYMFEPLVRSTATENIEIDSDSAESSDSCCSQRDGHTTTSGTRDTNKDQQEMD